MRTTYIALATALVLTTADAAAARPDVPARRDEGFVALWSTVGAVGFTPAQVPRLAHAHGKLQAVFAPASAVSPHDLGDRSAYATLVRAGVDHVSDAGLTRLLRRVRSGTPLTLLASQSVGLPNGRVATFEPDDNDCVGAEACATITVSISVTGVRPECTGPTILGVCISPSPPLPEFLFHTEQTVDVVRIDGGIDTLTPSRPHFRSTAGGDWGHRFKVTLTNPNRPGAGAHYLATADGEWAPVDLDTVSFPPGVSISHSTTLISGFCLRWDVRYADGTRGSRHDNFQLRGDVTLGVFTGHQWIHNEGICTL